jgi:uncharacterized membrane protein YdjX (TVP38/TMEM64 family)
MEVGRPIDGEAALAQAVDGEAAVDVQAPERGHWAELAVGVASIAIGAGIVALVPELRHALSLALEGDLTGLRNQFRALGGWGVTLLLALAMVHAVIFYPTELVTAAAGLVYGFLPGLALVAGGWLASALLAYLLGSTVGKPLAHLLFGRRRFTSIELAVRRGGVPLLLAMRLVPIVPFSLAGYVAGAVRVPLWCFSWTTLVGYLPQTALVAYLGSQSRSLSVTDPRLWAGLGVMLVLLAGARRLRVRPQAPAEDRSAQAGCEG